MSSTICNITFDCADPPALARFWGQVTGLPVIEEPQPGYPDSAVGDSRPRLYFVKVPEGKIVSDRRPDVGWVIMADPEGDELCVEMSRAELDAALAAESSGQAQSELPGLA